MTIDATTVFNLHMQAQGGGGTSSVEVTVAAGPLRIFGKSFVICTGTLLSWHGSDVGLPPSDASLPPLKCCVDILFRVESCGVLSSDLEKLMAAMPPTSHCPANKSSTTFLEGSMPVRYPDYQSGAPVLSCRCERRDLVLSRAGAVVLHAVGLLHIELGPIDSSLKIPLTPWVAPKVDRHAIFASWIMNTFGGLGALAAGVVDVAGGKGHLSNAIASCGVPCTLVDPFAGLGRDPVAGIHMGDGLDGSVGLLLNRDVRCVKATLEDAEKHVPNLMSECGAVVALHPDEATEPALLAAHAARRPFAVVPCCVFRKHFPGRLLKNGGTVVKYGNFLRYLREKDSRIRVCKLPFAGRNVVLYMTAADFDLPSTQHA